LVHSFLLNRARRPPAPEAIADAARFLADRLR
jgi:hypothetical protein